MAPLSPDRFAQLLDPIRPALITQCAGRVGQDAEDLVQDVTLYAFDHLITFDATITPTLFACRLARLLERAITFYRRRRAVEAAHIAGSFNNDAMDGDGNRALDLRYAALEGDLLNDTIIDVERLEELQARMRTVALTWLQEQCLRARWEGEAAKETAERLGTTRTRVNKAARKAIRKLRQPVSGAAAVLRPGFPAADLDRRLWRARQRVTIYRPPQRTGAALAKERLAKMK